MKNIIVYHHPCLDGFASMLAAKKGLGDNTECLPGKYEESLNTERFRDRHVYLVDFSWKKDYLEKVLEVANYVTILDHHKTAKEELEGFEHPKLKAIFCDKRSGVGTVWSYGFSGYLPELYKDVQDRDLWKWERPNSKAVCLYLDSIGFDEEKWTHALTREGYQEAVAAGNALLNYQRKLCEDLASMNEVREVAGYKVPVIYDCPKVLVSETLHILAKGQYFAAAKNRKPGGEGFLWSLRAADEEQALDVSEIAKNLGGGGHAKAAGFHSEA